MDPVSIVSSIFELYAQIQAMTKLVKANKAQCERLVERIGIITDSLKGLDFVKASAQYKEALQKLQRCIEDCLNFVSEFAETKWYKKFLNRNSHKEKFVELNELLEQTMRQLNLGLNVQQVMNREHDFADQKEDMQSIQCMQANIVQLNMAELETMQNIASNMEEQKKVFANQYESIMSQLQRVFLPQAPTQENKQEEIDYHILVLYFDIMFDEVIGKGSFGTIYLGRLGQQPIAIKTLEGVVSDEDRQQFIREVKIMSRLRNENITQFYGVCIEEGRLCLLMEHMSQDSLFKFLKDRNKTKQLTPELRHRMAIEIALGLSYLHDQKVIHCDLKSANVLLNADLRAKLTDFGLSKICTQSIISIQESSSAIQWMAPELLSRKGGTRFTERTDIYGYGTILWEIMTGLEPFAGQQEHLVSEIRNGRRETIPDDMPEVYKGIIKRCWSDEPKLRPPLSEILRLLREYTPKPPVLPVEELCQLASEHESKKEYKQAFQFYSQAAYQGDSVSQVRVGAFFMQGKNGIPRDKKKAYESFLAAAEQDNKRAQYNLAMMLEYGDGVPRDLETALRWYEEAKKNGNPDAQKRIDRVTEKIQEAGPKKGAHLSLYG